MVNEKSSAGRRLSQVSDLLTFQKTATTIPFDPESTRFPTRKDVPRAQGAPEEAAWVWGEDDQLGRLNLLTPTRVLAASKEIRTGEMVPLNLPLDIPKVPAFGREQFEHEIKVVHPGLAFDDLYRLNTQSGTQLDGFRHFAHVPTGVFYNNTRGEDIMGPDANSKCGIGRWAQHGIAGRGVLLDYRTYAKKNNNDYEVFEHHEIPWDELYRCGKDQGIDIRPQAQGGDIKIGDILMIRSGFVEEHYKTSEAERASIGRRGHVEGENDPIRYAGVKQEEPMLDWLHDCWFAAVCGDAPSFEAWPPETVYYMHEKLLSLWGCPIGELFDLEGLAAKCRERNRWTFFVTCSPANVAAGVGSHANATAIF
ncbi:MAG: hypothetical protein M1833_000244 [Piccolia ochrophora]|nr:MAG: hypothetical protein M1833_000244 [Piccolia ochrophora]